MKKQKQSPLRMPEISKGHLATDQQDQQNIFNGIPQPISRPFPHRFFSVIFQCLLYFIYIDNYLLPHSIKTTISKPYLPCFNALIKLACGEKSAVKNGAAVSFEVA